MSTLSVHRLENVQDFDFANTPFVTAFNAANGAYDASNASYLATNTAYNFANSVNTFAYGVAVNAAAAFAAANNVAPQVTPAFLTGNLAYALANNAYASINSNWTVTNALYSVANSAYGAANNVGPQIAPTYNTANAAYGTANAAYAAANTKFSSSGGTISGAVEITADLTVHGNTRFVDQQTLSVGDPLIYLAANNYSSDVVDIGFVANYVNTGGANVHTGLYRSSGTKEYYLFYGYDKEPLNNYIDPTGNNITKAILNADIRTSNLILGGANTINWITSSYNTTNTAYASINSNWTVTNTVYGVANAAFGKANTALQNTSGTLAGSLTIAGTLSAATGNTYFYTGPAYYASARVGPRPAGDNTSSFEFEYTQGVGSKFDVAPGGLVIYPNTATGLYTSIFDRTGNFYNNASIRSPIFYDSDNTGYYVDPATNSRLTALGVGLQASNGGKLSVTGGHSDSTIRLTAQGDQLGSGVTSSMHWWVSEPNITWNAGGFGYNVTNDGGTPSGFGRPNTTLGQAYMRFGTDGTWTFYNTDTSGNRYANMEMYPTGYVSIINYLVGLNSLRAPIFYDSDNTGYYVDPSNSGASAVLAGTLSTGSRGITKASMPAGTVLQVQQGTRTSVWTTTTAGTWQDIGVSVTITPTSSTSKVLVYFTGMGSGTPGVIAGRFRLMRDSTVIAAGDASGTRTLGFSQPSGGDTAFIGQPNILWLDSPATTSTVTYKVQAHGENTGLFCVNRTIRDQDGNDCRGVSTITVAEIAQ